MHDWHEAPLQDFLTRITYGFTNPMPTTEDGPYKITARDINGGRILYEQARSTSDHAYRNDITDKSRPDMGDVLVTKDGTLGRIAVVDRRNICINQSVALLKPSNRIRSRFLKYLLEEPINFARMIGDADGTTIKHIYVTRLGKMLVRVPSLSTQDKIVTILGALDNKIELNRRMNETLESMARAVFKNWFVDFGPTRAKAEGREPYLAPELWDLFPDAIDDEDKPVGWEKKPLDAIATFLNGVALQKFPASDSEKSFPVIKIAELRGGITAKSGRASREVPKKYVVKNGDFLFSWSGSLLARFWTEGDGALNQHLFKVSSDRYPAWFFSQWVYHHLKEFQAIAASKATTMGHIQRRHLKEALVVCPPDDVLAVLGQTVGLLVHRTIKNDLEARTLSQTRDLLLPRLMSGKIRLNNAREFLTGVA